MVYKGTISVLNEATKVISTNITLNCGVSMPVLGFGTYTIKGTKLIHSVIDVALATGYRAFDTAAVYGNEKDIGLALKDLLLKYNLKREDIFITSKLAPRDQGGRQARAAVARSLEELGIDYLDLFLVHWPGAGGVPADSPANARLRADSWQGLAQELRAGRLKALGVSNYTERHLRELKELSPSLLPAVNQVEFHPLYDHPKELYEVCEEWKTLLQAYSSLGGNEGAPLLKERAVLEVGKRLQRQPAQVLLRWALQRGYGVIPKSVTPERIVANAELDFVLAEEDMALLNALNRKHKFAWDPTTIL